VIAALLAAFVAAAAQTAPSPAPSPAPTPKPFTLEVDVGVVSVTAVVHDKAGRPIRGLGPRDVQILEDGVPQEVSYFREASAGDEKVPLSVVLALDDSGSMRHNVRFLKEAAVNFVHKLEETDRAMVVDFNEGVRASAEFTSDVERLEQFVEAMQPWGGTSLFDAIHYSLNRVKNEAGRKAVIVFSDGADTTSSMPEDDVVAYARAVEATVYCVGIRGESGLMSRGPRGFLRKIAHETGGEYFFPEKVGELSRVFTAISEELHNHYLLGYAPRRAPDGKWRAIELKVVSNKNAQVRVRKGYYAVARRPRRAEQN
jgi:VWFA-related protein